MTINIGIIQITSLFGTFDNVIQPQIYIQDKAGWYLFKINCITVGGNPIHGNPGGSNPHILTKNIGIIQITSLFRPFDNVIQPQIYIQDKA